MAVKAGNELEQQIKDGEQDLLNLQGDRDVRNARIAALEVERRKYIVAARARKEPKAQVESERITGEIENLRREGCDDEAAIAELTTHLRDLSEEKAAQEWHARCDSVRHPIKSRLKSDLPRQIANNARELTSLCDELCESDEQIVLDLLKFHPFLSPASRSVSGLTATRGEILICALGSHLPNMLKQTMAEHSRSARDPSGRSGDPRGCAEEDRQA